MSKIYTFILVLFLALTTLGLSAQNGICLDFDDLKPGDRIGKASNLSSGDLFYSKDAIDIRLQDFLYPNGTRGFESVLIYNGDNTTDTTVSGVNLFPSNINLDFDLTRLSDQAVTVCLDYIYWGGDINLAVNGADTFVLSSLEELLALDGKQLSRDPATTIEIKPNSDTRTRGTICISGTINSILIGGQEFTIDNFCVYLDDTIPACTIQDLKVRPLPCTPNDIFYMDLDFKVSEKNSGAYKVIVNNQIFGPFGYTSDSIPVGPIQTFGDEVFQVTVYDAEDETCKARTSFRQNCDNDKCSIDNLSARAVDCNPEDGSFFVALKFDADDTGDLGYSVFTHRGDSLGIFRYGDMPAVVGPFGNRTSDVLGFIVQDNANPGCRDTVFLESYACEPECVIDEIKAEITQCRPNGNYDIYLDVAFEHQYRDAPFAVFVDGIKVGEFRSGSLPLHLKDVPVYTDATFFELEVCPLFTNSSTLPEACCRSIRLDKETCPPACIFTDIKAKITDCLPNGNFDILLDLDYDDANEGAPFIVFVDGNRIGQFTPDQLPLQLENAPVYTDALDFMVRVCPLTSNGALEEACCLDFLLHKEDCQVDNSNCVLFDDLPSESYGGDQNPPNTEIFNVADISFRLFELQNLDWTMSYDKFAVLAKDDLPGFTQGDGQILYYDGIASILSFADYPDPIEELSVNFYNTGSHLNLSANGSPIQILSILSPGFYPLGNGVSVEVELLNSSGQEGTLTFYGNVQALLIGGDQLALDNLCINRKEPCEIGELSLKPTACDANGNFYLELNFRYANTSDYFIVKENGQGISQFAYADLPVKLGPFQTPYEAGSVFEVYDAQDDSCGSRAEFGPYFCIPACEIKAIEVSDIKCDTEAGVYSLVLEIKGESIGDKILVETKSGFSQRFEYTGRPILVEGIPLTNEGVDALEVCAPAGLISTANNRCCKQIEYRVPCTLECAIRDAKAYDIECQPDGTYRLSLQIEGINVDGGYYLVTRNGFEYKFRVENGMAHIDNLPIVPGTSRDGFKFCKVENNVDECCSEVSYEVPCQQFCGLEGISFFDFTCNPDSTYNVSLKIDAADFLKGEFLKFVTESGFETRFEWTGEVVTLENIPNLGFKKDYYQLCAPNYADCCVSGSYEVPCELNDECRIGELKTETLPCEPDGSFFVNLDFKYANTSDGFEVRVDGQSIGKYRYKDLPVRVGPIYQGIVAQEYHKLEVVDLEKNCGQSARIKSCVFEACNFDVAKVTPLECKDGEFYAEIQVQVTNPQSDGYLVFAEGELFGPYQYNSRQRVIVGPFAGDGTSTYDFLFVDLGDPSCYGYQEIGPIECKDDPAPCEGISFRARPSECNEDGEFKIELDLDIDLAVIYPVVIEVNGVFYDSVQVANTNFSIGPFKAGENYVVKIIDGWNPECVSKVDLGLVECSDDCNIKDLSIDLVSCYPDGSYELLVDFKYEAKNEEEFSLIGANGEKILSFKYSDLPLRVERVKVTGDAPYLSICVGSTGCCTKTFVQFPECIPCSITEAKAFVAECYPDSVYLVGIRADWDLNSLDQYMILEGDIAYPILERGTEGSLIIGPFFLEDANSERKLEIIDLRNPNCVIPVVIPVVNECEKDEDVWPGDANLDNTANHLDLLSLGFAWGKEGPARTSVANSWSPTAAVDWGNRLDNSNTDLKHADCNGDGVVDERDIDVIRINYGQTHGTPRMAPELPNTDSDPPLFFDVSQLDSLPENGYFNIPIVLGSEDMPLADLYGVAFTIEFDPTVFDADQLEIVYPTSWLGEPGVNLATLDYNFRGEGKVDIALTRTDQNEVSGYGVVAYFRGIRDDIVGRHQTEVRVQHGFGVHVDQQIIQLNGLNSVAPLKVRQEPTRRYGLIDLKAGMLVYPNPSAEIVHIDNRFGVPIDALQVLTTNGSVMSPRYEGVNELNVSELPEGLYLIRVEIGGYVIHQKLFKAKSR